MSNSNNNSRNVSWHWYKDPANGIWRGRLNSNSNINNNRTRHPSSSNNKNYNSNSNYYGPPVFAFSDFYGPKPGNRYSNNFERQQFASKLQNLAKRARERKKQLIAKKWLNTRPFNLRRDPMVIVANKKGNTTTNLITQVEYKPGNTAVMVLYKRMQGRHMRTKRFFLTRNSLAQLSGKPWRTIDRMKPSNIVLKKSPINRRIVYRRDVMNVKFTNKPPSNNNKPPNKKRKRNNAIR
jgi:hypothetical protein